MLLGYSDSMATGFVSGVLRSDLVSQAVLVPVDPITIQWLADCTFADVTRPPQSADMSPADLPPEAKPADACLLSEGDKLLFERCDRNGRV